MSQRTLRALAAAGLLLAVFLLAAEALARGRGGGGFSRGGGGFSRGGGFGGGGLGAGRPSPNISRSGPARSGTFGGPDVATRPGGGVSGPYGPLGSGPGGSNPRPSARPATPGDVRPGDVQPGDVRPGDVQPGDVQPGTTDREDRQERRSERREDLLEHREEVRQEYIEYEEYSEYEEYYEDRRYGAGVSLTAIHFRNLPCTTSAVVVGGVTYYECDSTWYTRAYSGGDVTYTVVDPPPGH